MVAINPEASYPEGPLADEAGVYYTEMGADRVMRWDWVANRLVWSRPGCGPTSVARAGRDLAILCHREESLVRISPDGETLAVIDRDRDGKPFMTPNASVNDQKGGVYFSSSGLFSPSMPAWGAVLYLSPEGQLTRVAESIHYANGVALSPDGRTLYVSEHLSRRVLAYDVADDGGLSRRGVFVALDDLVGAEAGRGWEVGPDGLAVDRAGNVYIAEYGAGRLVIVDRRGALLATLAVPERYITAPALTPDETHIYLTAPVSLADPKAAGRVYMAANPIHEIR